jgi:TolA-binding protein
LTGDAPYTYLAELRAGDILVRLRRNQEARAHYARVAEATPDSEEGKAARRALKQISID